MNGIEETLRTFVPITSKKSASGEVPTCTQQQAHCPCGLEAYSYDSSVVEGLTTCTVWLSRRAEAEFTNVQCRFPLRLQGVILRVLRLEVKYTMFQPTFAGRGGEGREKIRL